MTVPFSLEVQELFDAADRAIARSKALIAEARITRAAGKRALEEQQASFALRQLIIAKDKRKALVDAEVRHARPIEQKDDPDLSSDDP